MLTIPNTDHKNLFAVDHDGNCVKIYNQVLRGWKGIDFQEVLNDNSICMVSNWRLRAKTRDGRWSEQIQAICHCFRDEYLDVFPEGRKLYLFSESDFMDDNFVHSSQVDFPRKYDFCAFTMSTDHGIDSKAYEILPVILELAIEQGLRGYVVNYSKDPKNYFRQLKEKRIKSDLTRRILKTDRRLSKLNQNAFVYIHGRQEPSTITKILKSSRIAFFPNVKDASPRMITESLVCGTPVLLNKQIYGGWKYVNKKNGSFCEFPETYEDYEKKEKYYRRSIRRKIIEMTREKEFSRAGIREDYLKRYGLLNSAKVLASIINELEQENLYKYVMYRDFQDAFMELISSEDQKESE